MRAEEVVTMIFSCLKLLAIFNIKNAFIKLAETSIWGVNSSKQSIEFIRISKNDHLVGQNRCLLKIVPLVHR